MSAQPPLPADSDNDDPVGVRYPNTARIWNYWDTPLISRGRDYVGQFFEGFTLAEPGLVAPAQWHPELDNPLRGEPDDEGDDTPVLRLIAPLPPEDDLGVAWHLCGVGVKG